MTTLANACFHVLKDWADENEITDFDENDAAVLLDMLDNEGISVLPAQVVADLRIAACKNGTPLVPPANLPEMPAGYEYADRWHQPGVDLELMAACYGEGAQAMSAGPDGGMPIIIRRTAPALPLLQETLAAAPLADAELAAVLTRLATAQEASATWLANKTDQNLFASMEADEQAGKDAASWLPGLLARLAKAEAAAALPLQYKQERPATAWMPIYQGCKLPERGEWGEWCVLLNNYGESALEPRFGRLCGDDEGGLFWHLDNQEAWAFENFTHYIVLPGRPSAHDTVNRALLAATPVATVGSEPAEEVKALRLNFDLATVRIEQLQQQLQSCENALEQRNQALGLIRLGLEKSSAQMQAALDESERRTAEMKARHEEFYAANPDLLPTPPTDEAR